MRPLVLAVHGAAVNASTWLPLQRLVGDVYAVEATDLPGHGFRRGEPFVLETAIHEIVDRVATAGDRPVVLAGESLGGYLTISAAARLMQARAFDGGILAGVVAGSCTYPMRGAPALLSRMSLLADVITSDHVFRALTRAICDRETAAAIAARGFAPRMRGVTLRAILGYDIVADLATIGARVTLLAGALDIPIVWYARAMAGTSHGGSAVIVPRAGHVLSLTHPRTYAEAIRATLDRFAASSNR